MKQNGNDKVSKDYYIGLDVGTSSVGYAVTDKEYNVKKYAGNSMWGVRLFDEGSTAEERRLHRTNRRRLARRKWRLNLLEALFDEELYKIDNGFLMRLEESSLKECDKKSSSDFLLFNDESYTDKEYHKSYPTIYHLRKELIENDAPHDIRLVFLALRHIIKNRGHFLFDIGDIDERKDFDTLCEEFFTCFETLTEKSVVCSDINALHEAMLDKKAGKTQKTTRIASILTVGIGGKKEKSIGEKLAKLLSCGDTDLSKIFVEKDEYKNLKISLDMSDDTLEDVAEKIGDDFELIARAKRIYDFILLENITKGYNYISDYKIKQFKEHKKDLQTLKAYVNDVIKSKELKYQIFSAKKEKLCNYAAYSGYKKGDSETKCAQADFCKYLKGALGGIKSEEPSFIEMYARIADGTFAPKLRTSENGVIPNALHRKELVAILENAKKYLPFLSEKDASGLSVADKIVSIFDFRVPYYVGPLNTESKNHWVVRKDEKIYPWNFSEVVDEESSQNGFIERMTSDCTYTGEKVLPKNSLLYCEFTVLNEINNIKVNGKAITVDVKKKIYDELFVKLSRKVTKKRITDLLIRDGLIEKSDIVSGVNDTLTSSLSSYHKLRDIIEKTSYETAEEIIRQITLFGESKKLLKKWLEKNTELDSEDISRVLKFNFKEWGSLSEYFLTGIVHVDKQSDEIFTVMDKLRNSNENLMQILSSKYTFAEQAKAHRDEIFGISDNPREMVENLYVSPKIRRSIWQALRIVDEIVDNQKGAPKKIFVEVARDKDGKNDKKPKDSRKQRLIDLYKACKMDSGDLFDALNSEEESKLRSDKLFLYYSQFGKCMYSGIPISIETLSDNRVCDIDHIFPRSKIKDDSLDNRVLVRAEYNRAKEDKYPIKAEIREDMRGSWKELLDKGFISERKYERLVRNTELTDEELSSFVNRQLVETRQSTKAIVEILKKIYPKTKIVYSKADNVSEFRQTFDLIKCRDINDHHHAKDAYLNIVVGNYYDTRFSENFFKNIKEEKYTLRPDKMYKEYNVNGAWVSGENGTIATVRRMMAKNNILYSRMPYEKRGKLYKVTILPQGSEKNIPIKKHLSSKEYGGYTEAKTAYFVLVEHIVKKKTLRSIETVLIYQKSEFEKNPVYFAETEWKLKNPKIIIDKILLDSFFELNGVKYHITGRKGTYISFDHAVQLTLSQEDARIVKNICKYLERLRLSKEKAILSSFDGISKENNLRVYDLLYEKIKNSIYSKIYPKCIQSIADARGKFEESDLVDQCKEIFELIKMFKCNPQRASFSIISLSEDRSRILISKTLSSIETAYFINQSVSGLYEKKIDLLK